MKHTASQVLPKARDKGLLVRELNDELLVYDLDRHKAHCLNKTAAIIWNQCDGTRTVAQIAASVSGNAREPLPEEVVWLGLSSLQRSHLLKEPISKPDGARDVTRRDLLRIGVAAAVTLPVITSVIAPKAAEAATCTLAGGACAPDGPNANCCSGTCNGGTCN